MVLVYKETGRVRLKVVVCRSESEQWIVNPGARYTAYGSTPCIYHSLTFISVLYRFSPGSKLGILFIRIKSLYLYICI